MSDRIFSFLSVLGILLIIFIFSMRAAQALEFDPNTDYMQIMIDSIVSNNELVGLEAELNRNEKIDNLGLCYTKLAYSDILLLAKIAAAEAGDVQGESGDLVCQGIMEVVLNRVASFYFPSTIKEVLEQPGQYYYPKYANRFINTIPSERIVKIAIKVLNGESRLLPEEAIYHANGKMGGGAVYSIYMGYPYGTMYFSKA